MTSQEGLGGIAYLKSSSRCIWGEGQEGAILWVGVGEGHC